MCSIYLSILPSSSEKDEGQSAIDEEKEPLNTDSDVNNVDIEIAHEADEPEKVSSHDKKSQNCLNIFLKGHK
jgi:hypothetical protein